MVRVIGLSRLGLRSSLVLGGIGIAVACTSSRDFSGSDTPTAGQAGARDGDGHADGGTGDGGGAVAGGAVGGDTQDGGSSGSSVGASAGMPGNDGGAPPANGDAPVVVSVSPEDASADAAPGVSVKIKFSEALQTDTVSVDSVKLFDGDVAVEGEVRYSNQTVTFTPLENLSLNASYRVNVSTALTDLSGTPLKSHFSASFLVRDGVWSPAHSDLSPEKTATTQVSVGADGKGNVLFAWVEDGGSPQRVAARWYHSGIGWDPTATTMESGTVSAPAVAVSPEGDAVVAWISGLNYNAKRCLAGKWEGTAKKLGGAADGTLKPPVPSIRNGRALVTWPLAVVTTHALWSVYANSASGEGAWQADPTQVWTTSVENLSVRDPNVKQDASGDALLVFELAKTSFRQLFSATFASAGATWAAAAALDGTTGLVTDTGQGYSLAVTDKGNALVAWALAGKLMAGRSTKGKGFATPIEIDTLESNPIIAVAGGAQAVGDDFWVGWSQVNGVPSNVYANRYVAANKAWDGAKVLSDGVTSGGPPQLGVDRHGNALAIWLQAAAPKAPAVGARFDGSAWNKAISLYSGADTLTGFGLAAGGGGQAASVLVSASATSYALFE